MRRLPLRRQAIETSSTILVQGGGVAGVIDVFVSQCIGNSGSLWQSTYVQPKNAPWVPENLHVDVGTTYFACLSLGPILLYSPGISILWFPLWPS